MAGYIDALIKLILLFGFLFGLWLFVRPHVMPLLRNHLSIAKQKNMLKAKKNGIAGNRLVKHIQLLLYIGYNTKSINATAAFFLISFSCFMIMLSMLTVKSGLNIVTIFVSIFSGLLPYIFLQLKLHSIRTEGSYEAEGLVTELINQYKINYFNMVEAIDRAIPYLKECPHSKKALFRLSLRVKEYSSVDDIEQAVYEFVYAINTEWAVMLGMNITIAIVDGADVSESLDDILNDIKQLKSVFEKDKRENNEAFVMIKYFTIGLYIFTIIMAASAFKISLNKIFYYQFNTGVGFKFACVIACCTVVNFGLLYIFKKPKYDI
jgi:hypothetical protein